MTPLELLMVFIAGIVGPRNAYAHKMYADTIIRATNDPTEQRLLAVVAWAGNWFHLYEGQRRHTPYFDVTEYAGLHPTETITLDRGASLALRFLRLHHTNRCRGMGWEIALGRYHTGRCQSDALAVRQWGYVRRLTGP